MRSVEHTRTGVESLWAALMLLCLLLSPRLRAQTDTVDVPSDRGHGEGGLNAAVNSAIRSGTLSNTVFRLERYGCYLLDSTITVPAGNRLTIIAPDPGTTQETAPPQILWADSSSVNTSYIFDCYGDVALKNVWLLYANRVGLQAFSSIKIEDSPDTVNGQHGTFDNVIFDYSRIGADGSGAVSVTARHFRGRFTNCYFRNCVDQGYPWYGRALSFPWNTTGWHTDSLTFENCTFANLGIVYMQEDGNYADVVRFNHCTFLNTMVFALESGWWHWLSVTNTVFVNTFLYGYPSGHPLEPFGGTLRIDSISTFGFSVPFTEADRHILFTHSSYFIEDWVRDYMASMGDTTDVYGMRNHPEPMLSPGTLAFFDHSVNGVKTFPFMNKAYLYDSTDPGFMIAPTNQEAIRRFVWINWNSGADTSWAYHPEADLNQVWPMPENLSYTNPVLLTAGMWEFPLGDLYHWFPDRYAEWKSEQRYENERITVWLDTGVDPGEFIDSRQADRKPLPAAYALDQNYPNPFNPLTVIGYHLPTASRVKITVYDLLGREVRTLFEGIRPAGSYTASFDAGGLASGVYFYQLQTQGSVQTKKLILLK
jgi:hypothetical protein